MANPFFKGINSNEKFQKSLDFENRDLDRSSGEDSFEYSDSDELRDTIVRTDFKMSIALTASIPYQSKIKKYRESISSFRESIKNTDETLENLNNTIQSLHDRITFRNSELKTLQSNINSFSTDLGDASRSLRKSEISYKSALENFQKQKANSKNKVIEAELNFFIKKQELQSLRDYLKNLKTSIDFELSEKKLNINLMENRKNFASRLKGKILKKFEVNSLYLYLDSGIGKVFNSNFKEFLPKYESKIKNILFNELKIWSSSFIYQSMKIKVINDYNAKSSYIRAKTKERLSLYKKNAESEVVQLKEEIYKAQNKYQNDQSEKPKLQFKIYYLSRYLETLENRIKRKRKKRNKVTRTIKKKGKIISSMELKLAGYKSKTFMLNL